MGALSVLARNLLDGATLGPSFPMRHVSRLSGRRYHTATIRRAGKVTFRTDASDAETFIDIFRHGAYDFSWLKHYDRTLAAYRRILASGRSPVVIDAGANVGAASVWFCKTFPEARIIAVEPDPQNADVLRMNAAARPAIEVIEAAIGSSAGKVSLSNPDDQAWSVQTTRDETGTVAMTTIADVLARRDEAEALFLVKVDIEGFESDLFQGDLRGLDRVEGGIIEPHDWMLPGAGSSRNFQKAMLERDFEMVISGENLVYLRVRPSAEA